MADAQTFCSSSTKVAAQVETVLPCRVISALILKPANGTGRIKLTVRRTSLCDGFTFSMALAISAVGGPA